MGSRLQGQCGTTAECRSVHSLGRPRAWPHGGSSGCRPRAWPRGGSSGCRPHAWPHGGSSGCRPRAWPLPRLSESGGSAITPLPVRHPEVSFQIPAEPAQLLCVTSHARRDRAVPGFKVRAPEMVSAGRHERNVTADSSRPWAQRAAWRPVRPTLCAPSPTPAFSGIGGFHPTGRAHLLPPTPFRRKPVLGSGTDNPSAVPPTRTAQRPGPRRDARCP